MSFFAKFAAKLRPKPTAPTISDPLPAFYASEDLEPFIASLSDEELVRWDQLLESGLDEQEAVKVVRPYLEFHGEEWAWDTTDFDPKDRAFSDIAPLAKLCHLRRICINGAVLVTDIRPLQHLAKLERLQLARLRQLTDITSLSSLTTLTMLELTFTGVKDLAPLANMTSLEIFVCGACDVTDISPLATLTKLKQLEMPHCELRDISPVSGLINLETLGVGGRRIGSLSPLARLTKLETLWLNTPRIRDYSLLCELPNLRELHLHDCEMPHDQQLRLQRRLPELVINP